MKELSDKKTDSNARSKGKVTAPEYEVTIRAAGGRKIKGPIVVETNYKDTDASEVFAVRLDAVEPVSYLCWRADWEPRWVALANSWYYPGENEYHWTAIASERNNQVTSYMSPENYSYFSRSHCGKTNKKSFYFLKLLEGFSEEDFDDLYLEVRNYDESTNRLDDIIGKNQNPRSFNELIGDGILKATSGLTGADTNNKLKNLTGTTDIRELKPTGDKDRLLDSDYYFELTGSTTLKDTRIYVIYDPGTFRVRYDCDGGSSIGSNQPGSLADGRSDLYLTPDIYRYGDSYVVTEQTPVKAEYTFAGWELVKEEEPRSPMRREPWQPSKKAICPTQRRPGKKNIPTRIKLCGKRRRPAPTTKWRCILSSPMSGRKEISLNTPIPLIFQNLKPVPPAKSSI